jgi:phage virion morphogenesis protein
MAGANITLTIDAASALQGLANLRQALADPTPAMREIGEVLTASTKKRFGTETAPDGTPWAPNSRVTIERYTDRGAKGTYTKKGKLSKQGIRRVLGKKVLTDHGYLGDTIEYQLQDGGRAVAVGSNRFYGAMQQFGGTRAQWPHLWGDIPARPFLGISDADRARIREILQDHLDRPA